MAQLKPSDWSPKAFLKARRPERFSDTATEEETVLDRSLLEFHLDSLTSRGQETDFERFAKQLCAREVCPNLLPHTGPGGGGDSKVDSETFPVADDLALAWYVGTGREAARERWAFAFSAKKEWPAKIRTDVAKLVLTGRGYTKAFFVTNQAVPDRKRAQMEDALRRKHSIDVRILDRTWILDSVFNGKHEALAQAELGVTALSRRTVIKGPLDARRESRLAETENRLREALQSGQLGSALVADALDAAELARELELPRAEVAGRFTCADELARKCGTRRQRVEVSYQWAWTLFWWFEDRAAFVIQYGLVNDLVAGSQNSYDLEELFTLWTILYGIVKKGLADPDVLSFTSHTDFLIGELQRLSAQVDRPSTALQAESLLHQVRLALHLSAGEPLDTDLRALREVVLRSEGLAGYPLEPLVETLIEIGYALEGSATYDALFETILSVASARKGELRAARLLLRRGEIQLRHGRPVAAVDTLGRALGRLSKHESRHDIVRALYLCGCAYDEVGLHWAARGTVLAAASVSTDELWRYGDVTLAQAACYRRLKWIELRLGRIPHILAWHERDMSTRLHLVQRGYDQESLLLKTEMAFQTLLGSLFLRADPSDLEALESLPDALDNLGLPMAADALLYALGHEERLRAGVEGTAAIVSDTATDWRRLSPDAPVAERPDLYYGNSACLRSSVLGCKVTVKCAAQSPCVEVGESLLAALESLLSTCVRGSVMACESELNVDITLSDAVTALITSLLEERAGRPHLQVLCHPCNLSELIGKQQAFRDGILDLVATAVSHIVLFKDPERDLEALFKQERAGERALTFAGSVGVQLNILGSSPKTRLSSWTDSAAHSYQLRREVSRMSISSEPTRAPHGQIVAGHLVQGAKPPPELLETDKQSHAQMATVSLIRISLWNRAGWSGALFIVEPGYECPPVLGLIFRNRDAGRAIFAQWRQELGDDDSQGQLRLAVVRSIDRTNPHAYRIVIGSNPERIPAGVTVVAFMSRIHRMDPTTPLNLDRFLRAQRAVGAFLLVPAFVCADFDGSQEPEPDFRLAIRLRTVHVRQAWEIGPNDIDAAAIASDDSPVIPETEKDPPVAELLRSRTERNAHR
jgi:hypothetical protein